MNPNTDLAVVGTYTKDGGDGLLSYVVDHQTARFSEMDRTYEANPSFLAPHPSGGFIIAVNELEEGTAVTYGVNRQSGELTQLDRTSTGGASPCHVAIDPRGEYAVVSNYAGGSVALLEIDDHGTLTGPVVRHDHEGSGAHPDRQTQPHPHSAFFVSESVVYIADLGTDQLYVYELCRESDSLDPIASAHVSLQDGAGPRHFAVHPSRPVGYLVNELDLTLSALDLSDPATPTTVRTVSAMQAAERPERAIAADVHVHPDGEYVLASIRGDDRLAVFAISPDPLNPTRIACCSTNGQWPRNFSVSPNGDRVYACHQHSNDVLPYSFHSDTGGLERTGDRISIRAPVCLRFF